MRNRLSKIGCRALATIICASVLGCNVSANPNFRNNVKTFAKKHPVITSGASIIGAGSLIAGTVVGIIKLNELVSTLRVHTDITDIPKNEIKDYLDNQIKEFEGFGDRGGTKLFAISDEILNEADPYVLASVINAINKVFEQKPFLADILKEKLAQNQSYFCVDWCENKQIKLFCRLSAPSTLILIRNTPLRLEINKTYGRSLYKTKKLSKNDSLSAQKQVVAALGDFFDNLIALQHKLNLSSISEQVKNKGKNFNENEFYSKFNYYPFKVLLADYVLKARSDGDVLMQIFKGYLDSLEKNWKNDKSMFMAY